ncbi:MAG: 1-(5-phosphoribosyl)-5-[(5-phosphoribosylamino)methylideneamino]imidazole-4-carboxamide isomerase [Caulobacterales bacterium]|nr:1-(5-phosphoribosyl)-5-[(5-phosphoribosylamino)methylideneamino]imidazole-4-carboxamide isomerase [Caulobacterales bacterium]
MILYPAIDLKDGHVVRLVQGRMEDATVFSEDPAAQARVWREAGFSWLHVVDLDGAVTGAPKNAGAVAAVLEAVDMQVQLGGGVRSLERIAYWLGAGVRRVVLGTVAVRDPGLVREAAADHPGRIAVAVDVRAGKVAVEGWVEATEIDAVDLAKRFEDAGVAALIVTDIDRDGLNEGVNIELSGRVADATSIPVIASGGLASAAEITALRSRPGAPIAGAVIGRALYDGHLTPADALAAAG